MSTQNTEQAIKVQQMLDVQQIKNSLLELIPGNNKEHLLKSELASLLLDINADPKLQTCTEESLLACLKKTLPLGLKIGSQHKEAYVIAGSSKKTINGKTEYINEAQIRIGYPAYVNVAYRDFGITFSVQMVTQEEVDKKLFGYNPVTEEIKHDWSPELETKIKTKDNIKFVYVIATNTNDDRRRCSRPYTVEELCERAKQKRKSKSGGYDYYHGNVWKSTDRDTDFGEMVSKTALIHFCKLMPTRTLNDIAQLDYKESHAITNDALATPPTITTITEQQAQEIEQKAERLGVKDTVLSALHVAQFSDIPLHQYDSVINKLQKTEQRQLEAPIEPQLKEAVQ